MPDPIESVEADTAIGKFKISGASVNNLLTILSFVGIALLCWVLWAHAGDAKEGARAVAAELRDANKEVAAALRESNKELTTTLREMARATREQNCLLSLPINERSTNRNAETCRRLSQ